jgi:hypothetical protein
MIDPSSYSDALRQALSVLANAREIDVAAMTAPNISAKLLSDHGLKVHWRSLQSQLSKNSQYTARKKLKSGWHYSIVKAGEDYLRGGASAMLIDPAKSLQETVTFHGMLGALKGKIYLCDPYLDHKTVEHLDACAKPRTIEILTSKITDDGQLRRLVAAAQRDGLQITVRRTPDIHDRYLIDDHGMLLIGTSLNSFGNKQAFIVKLGQDIRAATLKAFQLKWSAGQPWP